jgi:pimeloyl-ACP methyl ester carboxylesterase
VAILRACGHVLHREKEAAVLEAVREFLANGTPNGISGWNSAL